MEEVYIIKSLSVQNSIMLIALGVVALFLLRSVVKKKKKHIIVFSIWIFIVIWFFNSPFFGFSTATIGKRGIQLEYGILSFRNATLNLDSKWEIKDHLSGIRKNRRLYFIEIGSHSSMKVKGKKGVDLLKKIGASIEEMRNGNSQGLG